MFVIQIPTVFLTLNFNCTIVCLTNSAKQCLQSNLNTKLNLFFIAPSYLNLFFSGIRFN